MYGNPYGMYQSGLYPQPMQLNRVNGIEGARALAARMAPNSQAPAFDGNDDIMYIVSTDSAGYPTIEKYGFSRIDDRPTEAQYVTRKEFEELKEMLSNGKQSVRKQAQQQSAE